MRFREKYPHILLRLQASLSVSDLEQEGIDIAIRMGRGEWEGVKSHFLFADELMVVAAPNYNGGKLPATPEEVAASNIIFFDGIMEKLVPERWAGERDRARRTTG